MIIYRNKKNNLIAHRLKVEKLAEKDIIIDLKYSKPIFLSKLLGLVNIKVNEYEFKRAVRITDYDANLPSFLSIIYFPGILFKYIKQKITKTYIVKNPKPFLVVDAVNFIQKKLKPKTKVLEIGAGNSTLWFLNNGCIVKAVEHNEEWAQDIIKKAKDSGIDVSSNLQIKIAKGIEAIKYLSTIKENFDVIIVDSMNEFISRYESIRILKNKLNPNGIIVLDNSDGINNWKAKAEMDGIINKSFTGFAYNCPSVCQTTIWEEKDIKFQVKNID